MQVLTPEERLYVSGGSGEGGGNFFPELDPEMRLGLELIACGAGIAMEAPSFGLSTGLTVLACGLAGASLDEELAREGITPAALLDEVIVYGENLMDDILEGIGDIVQGAIDILSDAWQPIGELLSDLGGLFCDAWDALSNVFTDIGEWFRGLFGGSGGSGE